MPRVLDAGEGLSRTNLYAAYPEDIIANEGENGRYSTGEIDRMAGSFERNFRQRLGLGNGQLQAAICERLEDGRVKLVAGYRRRLALIRINEAGGFDSERVKIYFHVVDKLTPADALEINASENSERKNLRPMDRATIIGKFRALGEPDNRVARVLGFNTTASVTQYAKLLELEPCFQELVQKGPREGGISANMGILLAGLPSFVARSKAVAQAAKKGRGKKIRQSALVQAARSEGLQSSRTRRPRELKDFWEDWRRKTERGSPGWWLGQVNLEFIAGRISSEEMAAKLRKVLLEGVGV